VPVGLGQGRKTGTFPPRLRNKAAKFSGFTAITRRNGRISTGQNRRKNAPTYPVLGVGVCPRCKLNAPVYRPDSPHLATPAVNRTRLQSKCRSPRFMPHKPSRALISAALGNAD
jgi:hypothetical protein